MLQVTSPQAGRKEERLVSEALQQSKKLPQGIAKPAQLALRAMVCGSAQRTRTRHHPSVTVQRMRGSGRVLTKVIISFVPEMNRRLLLWEITPPR